MTKQKTKKIAFVCLGNICRSPLALAVFRVFLERNHPELLEFLVLDSAGTSGHTSGRRVDSRSYRIAEKNETRLPGVANALKTHVAKQVNKEMLEKFDYVLVMDDSNESNIYAMAKRVNLDAQSIADRVFLFGSFSVKKEGWDGIIEDPWYGGEEDFATVYEQCLDSAVGFTQHLQSLLH